MPTSIVHAILGDIAQVLATVKRIAVNARGLRVMIVPEASM
jgi:hypothetical protein